MLGYAFTDSFVYSYAARFFFERIQFGDGASNTAVIAIRLTPFFDKAFGLFNASLLIL
jgi:hypothetical protein